LPATQIQSVKTPRAVLFRKEARAVVAISEAPAQRRYVSKRSSSSLASQTAR
jgi:hypothetical protein